MVSRVEGDSKSIPVPQHAYLDYNGNDWRCENGFERRGDTCQSVAVSNEKPVDLPEHAFATAGNLWRCEQAFRRVRDACERVRVPGHAHLNASGNGWSREQGFTRQVDCCTS